MNLIQISILAVAIFSSTCWSSTSPFVMVSTSVSSSSSSSSSSAEPLDDSLAVEGRNVKIVRRIRVRTSTTPAPVDETSTESSGGSEFTEAPEYLEWFAVKHKEFERVKAGEQAKSVPDSNTNRPTVVPTSAPVSASGPSPNVLKEAEYVYEFSDTSNGPRVQVIYGDGKTPPPAGLMESPDMMELVREHLYDTKSEEEQSPSAVPPATQAPAVPSPPPTPQHITIVSAATPQSPQDSLLPPIYHVGGGPIATGPPASAPPFFSPYHGPAYTPDTEMKTYVRSMPPVFTQPTSVTMPAVTVPGMRATSAWKWPTYVQEQENSFPFQSFDYNFPSFPSSGPSSGPPPGDSTPNYYPADLPFSPYQEPVYTKPPVAYTKSRPESSPNSIPWTPIPSSSPSFALPGFAYQKAKAINAINTVPDTQVVAESSNGDVGPGSYSTLGKRMTAPDMRSPSVGEYPAEDFPQDSVVKGSHYVDSYSTPSTFVPESQPANSHEYFSGPSDDEYSNYIMGSSPSYEVSAFPSFAPMPNDMSTYSQSGESGPGSVPPPKTMYFDYQGPSVSPYNPFIAQPPSLPSYYSPGPSPYPQKNYKIIMVKPPTPSPVPVPAEQSNLVNSQPNVVKKIHHHVLMVQNGQRAGPAARKLGPPPPPPPSPSKMHFMNYFGKYKKRSTNAKP